MNYRPVPDDREEQYNDYLSYAFSPEDGPQDEHDWDTDEQPGDARALFDGDEMLCVCRHYWFRAHLRGRWTEMPGLSAVATPPEHRRKGNVARLLAESLAEYRDRGDFLTALWAFSHSFYERQGWGLANKYVQYDCDPGALAFARQEVRTDAGQFRPVDADDHEALGAVLAADHGDRELAVERTEKWWRRRIFEGHRKDPYAYGWADDEGELRGFVVYRVEAEDDGKRLEVRELAAADHEARLHCLRFLADHDSQVDSVTIYGPPDTDLLDLTADPADVECEVKAGPMVRLVDVPAAFEALEYHDVTDTEFTVSVADPLADWNDGTFRVAVEDGRARCERTDAGATDAGGTDAAVTTGVGPLSQVFVGYHSVADAERITDLEVRDPAAHEALTAMFPEREVLLRENF